MRPNLAGKPAAEGPGIGLSDAARTSFDLLVQAALARNLAGEGEHAQVQVVTEFPRKTKDKKAVVLTIASDMFRLVLALHVRLDAEGKAHFARLNRVDAAEWSEQAFHDAVAECGNVCCGALNRELGRYFVNVGMSTPNLLDREALAYVEALGKGHRRLFQVNGLSVDFYATLFVAPFAPIDFRAEMEAQPDEVDAGELEMF